MLESFLSKKRTEIANKIIPSEYRKGRILDIGCGEYPYFLISTDFKEKYGIDRLAEEKIFDNMGKERIFIKRCDIEETGLEFFNEGHFDVVTMLAVFEHIEPRKLLFVIKEIKRILRFNGILILTTPSVFGHRILQVLSKLRLINVTLFREHKALYDVNKISSILVDSGFSKEYIKYGNFELFMNIWVSAIKK